MAAAHKRSEPFSSVDAAWLHMDTSTNLAMITGVLMFDEPLDYARLKATIEQRMLRYDRFRQRVKEPRLGVGLPRWETDPHFDWDYHLPRVTLPPPGDQVALQKLAGELMSTPLDRSRPLWQWHVVEDCHAGGCAIIMRLHHCIADGLSLVQVMLNMTDAQPDAPPPGPRPVQETRSRRAAGLLEPATRLVGRTMNTAGALLDQSLETLARPSRLYEAMSVGTTGALALSKLTLYDPDRETLFKGKLGVSKRTVWSAPIPLEEIKALGKGLGATINDVLTTAVVGALRRYLEKHDEAVAGLNIRAMVPVNLRPPGDVEELGNRFGLVLLSLPIGIGDPVQRARVLKQRMDEIKESPEAMVAFGILGAMGMSPVQIEKLIARFFTSKATIVLTNVPGPREALYLAGKPLRGMMFWVPTAAQLGMGVSILSYAGEVILGVATDEGLVPDPETIIAGFHQELARMERRVQRAGPKTRAPAAKPARASAKKARALKPRRREPVRSE